MTCLFSQLSVTGAVAAGSLNPTVLYVNGVLDPPRGARRAGNQVIVRLQGRPGQQTVFTGPTGAFSAAFAAGSFECNQSVTVVLNGAAPAGPEVAGQPPPDTVYCSDTLSAVIVCDCVPISIAITPGPCAGSPPTQDITLAATIKLPPGPIGTYRWDFGDGQTHDFTPAAPSTPATVIVSQQHRYAPSTTAYTASLKPVNSECEPSEAFVDVRCDVCPVATGTAKELDCDKQGRRRFQYTIMFNPPLPQGAVASVFWADGTGQPIAPDQLNTAAGPVGRHSRVLAQPGQGMTATFSVVVNGQPCFIQPVDFSNTPSPCFPCPGYKDEPPVAVSVALPSGLCAPVPSGTRLSFAATVNWPPGVSGAPAPVQYGWAVKYTGQGMTRVARREVLGSATNAPAPNFTDTGPGWRDDSAALPLTTPNGEIDLSRPGHYTVECVVEFPPNSGLQQTPVCPHSGLAEFDLNPCTADIQCPGIDAIAATTGCADPAAGVAANINFTLTVTNPSNVPVNYEWDFGDPNSGAGNRAMTVSPSAAHSYQQPGSYQVRVTVRATGAACVGGGPQSHTTGITVQPCPCPPGEVRNPATGRCDCPPGEVRNAAGRCDCPPGQTRDSQGRCVSGAGACGFFLTVAAILAGIGLVILASSFCLPLLATPPAAVPDWVVFGIGAGFVGAAAVIILIVFLVAGCPVPCGYFLLLCAQIFIGAGYALVYFRLCCPFLGWIGLGALIVGGIFLGGWIAACKPDWCTVFKELSWVLLFVVSFAIAYLLLVAVLRTCALSVLPGQGQSWGTLTPIQWVHVVIYIAMSGAYLVITAIALACTPKSNPSSP